MAALLVVKPGLQTTIQDQGRWGFQSFGVPVAGPMDPCSHRLANALVGNDARAATLEITLVGPEVEFEGERVVAVTGAEFVLTLDGRVVEGGNRAFVAPAGSRLRFGSRGRGSRAYLAIAGGVAVTPTLGSRSTHLVSRTGGLDGRALAAGDRVPVGEPNVVGRRQRVGGVASHRRLAGGPVRGGQFVEGIAALPDRHARIRVLPGPQRERFADHALDALQSAPYTIANDSDRMGFRLQGPALAHRLGADIISDATPLGVLQVPSSGQPVLLMADRQTTGGYPKIATVITADIGIAGQLGPGDTISFEVCSRPSAMAALIAQERALMAIERR
jgi:antagonist of KipI